MSGPGAPPARRLALALVATALVALVAVLRAGPPAPRDGAAPLAAFSAARAEAHLVAIVGEGAPRPVGSPANTRARDAIGAAFRALGFTPELQHSLSCASYGACAHVTNVVARLDGAEPAEPGVLLTAHFDSVGAGPGAGDDAAGAAAVLEAARALRAGPRLRRSVVFAIVDGEEAGLLGARAFLEDPARARSVAVVVNLEGRGTTGASLLFETGAGDLPVVRALSGALARPVTSSVFSTVYQRMPFDTDLTVYREHGLGGVNFAFIGGASRYHTPKDDLAHLDRGSLQHHGDHAVTAVRALADAADVAPAGDGAVFFDVLAAGVVVWPRRAAPLVGALALFVALAAARVRRAPPAALARGAVVHLAPVLAALIATGLAFVARGGGARGGAWPAHPGPALASAVAVAFAAAALPGVFLGARRPRDRAAAESAGSATARAAAEGAAVAIGWGALGLVASLVEPGFSFLFVVPALAAAASPVAGAVVAAALFAAPLPLVYDALGAGALPLVAALAAVPASALAPYAAALPSARARVSAVAAPTLVAAIAAVAAGLVAPYSAEAPLAVDVVHHVDADTGAARLQLVSPSGAEPPALAALFPERAPAFPWLGRAPLPTRRAPASYLPPPTLDALAVREQDAYAVGGSEPAARDAGARARLVRVRLRSPRGAPVASLVFAPGADVRSVTFAGRRVPPLSGRALAWSRGFRVYACATLPAEGLEVTLELGPAPVPLTLADQSPGVDAPDVLGTRPADAVPYQDGDVTVVTRGLTL